MTQPSFRPSMSFDWVAERYDETRGGERRGRQFAGGLAPLLDKDKLVFEIGVGTGVISLGLRELGFRVAGLDVSENMLARAKARLGPRIVRADAQDLPLRSDSIEQAISVWVLHVVGDVTSVMREAVRVLRPGGRYLVMDGHFFEHTHDHAIAEAWRDISSGLGAPPRRNRADEWAELAPIAGLRVADMLTVGPYQFEESPAEAAHKIETRVHSMMKDVSDADFERVVRPVVERLRSLPDAETPLALEDHQDVLVLER